MKGTGKTTRAIDRAIQALFTNGEIVVHENRLINHEDIEMHPKGYYVAIDPDCDLGNAQRDFASRFFRRLDIEHGGMYTRTKKGSFYVVKTIP